MCVYIYIYIYMFKTCMYCNRIHNCHNRESQSTNINLPTQYFIV